MVNVMYPKLCKLFFDKRFLRLNIRSVSFQSYMRYKTSESDLISPMNTPKWITSRVVELYKMSSDVKGLKLHICENQEFAFKAGQWIDFKIPGIPEIGGYSICSSPEYLKETGLIELAVKYGSYPPTKWVHDKCKISSQVQIAVGGNFYFDINEEISKDVDLLLLAGGVGINPLLSIYRHTAQHSILRNTTSSKDAVGLPKVLLLYSVSKFEDLIFKDSITTETSRCPNLSCEFLVTSEETDVSEDLSQRVTFTTGNRLNKDSLATRLSNHFENLDKVTSYICGPNAMADDLNEALLKIGFSQEKIKFEKWW